MRNRCSFKAVVPHVFHLCLTRSSTSYLHVPQVAIHHLWSTGLFGLPFSCFLASPWLNQPVVTHLNHVPEAARSSGPPSAKLLGIWLLRHMFSRCPRKPQSSQVRSCSGQSWMDPRQSESRNRGQTVFLGWGLLVGEWDGGSVG